jgi:hypothetical protein
MQLVSEKRGRNGLFVLGFEGLIITGFSEAANDIVNLLDQARVEDRCRTKWRFDGSFEAFHISKKLIF